jgi:F0F1-type ATP synthase beta subunit
LSEDFAKSIGEILKIDGPVVETMVDQLQRIGVFDVLGSKTKSNESGSDLIVVQRLSGGRFKCIATGGNLSERAKLYSAGDYEQAVRGLKEEQIIAAVEAIAPNREKRMVETGIKVIDLLCPILAGGSIGIFGREGVGRLVQVQELIHRRSGFKGDIAVFFYVDRWHALSTQDILERDPDLTSDCIDNVQTSWIIHDRAGDSSYVREASYLDARLYFSPIQAIHGNWPALDPLKCHSAALAPEHVSAEHIAAAIQVRELLEFTHDQLIDPIHLEHIALGARQMARERRDSHTKRRLAEVDSATRTKLKRGLLLERFFTQSFYVAEGVTGKLGTYVTLADTIRSCYRILAGEFDTWELDRMSYIGTL